MRRKIGDIEQEENEETEAKEKTKGNETERILRTED